MKEFYTENYKNVTEEIKEDPNKQKAISYSWIERFK